MLPVSSETMIATASFSSVSPIAARWRVPRCLASNTWLPDGRFAIVNSPASFVSATTSVPTSSTRLGPLAAPPSRITFPDTLALPVVAEEAAAEAPVAEEAAAEETAAPEAEANEATPNSDAGDEPAAATGESAQAPAEGAAEEASEGAADEAAGTVQEGFGKARRKVGEALDDLGDKIGH